MCLILLFSPEVQSHTDEVTCNGCTTSAVHANASEDTYMYIVCDDGSTWSGVVKDYQGSGATVCGEDLTG